MFVQSIRSYAHKFIELHNKLLTEQGGNQERFAKILAIHTSTYSNLFTILQRLIAINEKTQEYMIKDGDIIQYLDDQCEMATSLSIESFLSLKSYVEKLRTFKREYKNTSQRLIKLNEQDFFDSLDWSDITQLDIIGHTGQHIFLKLHEFLVKQKSITRFIRIRILLKSIENETSRRASKIMDSIRRFEELKNDGFECISLLFYDNLPVYRGIICYRKGSFARQALIGSYYFPNGFLSKRAEYAFSIEEKNGRHFNLDLFNSWFKHFWGKGRDSNITHTIIIDFDDTIVNSHGIQIKAWLKTIRYLESEYSLTDTHLNSNLTLRDSDAVLLKKLTAIFFKYQMANKIIDEIFLDYPTLLNVDDVQKIRFDFRQDLMLEENETPSFFDDFILVFKELVQSYNVIILSATDELLIKKFLRQHPDFEEDFLEKITYIFGNREKAYDWDNLFLKKSKMTLKISSLLGIPLSRMVYVGDNQKDYVAMKRIGMDFIEARLFGDEVENATGNPSLIESDCDRVYFTHWKNFIKALQQIEKIKKERLFPGLL